MNWSCSKPPDCCVIIELEEGARLGYRRAVLLNEIHGLGSISLAAKTSRVPVTHALELVRQMNRDFSLPLVVFTGTPDDEDRVCLTKRGEDVIKIYWRLFEPVWLAIMEERSRHY